MSWALILLLRSFGKCDSAAVVFNVVVVDVVDGFKTIITSYFYTEELDFLEAQLFAGMLLTLKKRVGNAKRPIFHDTGA